MFGMKIRGTGIEVPSEVVTNQHITDLLRQKREEAFQYFEEAGIDLKPEEKERLIKNTTTSPEWIEKNTGVSERRWVKPRVGTSVLGAKSVKKALENSGLKGDDLEFIILATVTPDYLYSPPTATIIAKRLGLKNNPHTEDISVACSSFLYALNTAYGLIRSGLFKRGAVVGADVMSSTLDFFNRDMTVLLGDGAGILIVEATDPGEDWFSPQGFFLGSIPEHSDLISTPSGGSRQPLTVRTISDPRDQGHKLRMDGPVVRKLIVDFLIPANPDLQSDELSQKGIIFTAIKKAGLKISDIDFFGQHQANLRIGEHVDKRFRKAGFEGKTHHNIQRLGNTTSATIPILVHEALQEGKIKPGSRVLLSVFGGGVTFATVIFQWGL